MKPIGSITNYFPFIEEGERELILSLVEESSNYSDFVVRLCNHVMTVDSSGEMIFLAWHHLGSANYSFKAREKFLDRFSQQVWLRPEYTGWIMDTIDWDEHLKVVEETIAKSSNPLILFHLYLLKMNCIRGSSIGTLTEDETIQCLIDLIQNNPSLEFARSKVYLLEGERYENESNPRKGMQVFESALQHTMKFNDVAIASQIETNMAKILSLTDPSKAMEYIDSAATRARDLGYLERKTDIFTVMGVIFDARGEYDAATMSFEEALKITGKQDPLSSLRFVPSALSRSYRRMGKLEEALEWANISLTSKNMVSRLPSIGVHVLSNLCMSAALSMLGRIEDAKSYHDVGNELALKVGIEVWLSDVHLSEGLIARAEGRFSDALESFENALEIMEKLHRQGRMNECLNLLAETEIQHYMETPESDGLLALHWIGVMEEMARRKDLPGVLGLALLQKARMLLLQGHDEESRAVLKQVKELSENQGTTFLQDRIKLVASASNPRRRE